MALDRPVLVTLNSEVFPTSATLCVCGSASSAVPISYRPARSFKVTDCPTFNVEKTERRAAGGGSEAGWLLH